MLFQVCCKNVGYRSARHWFVAATSVRSMNPAENGHRKPREYSKHGPVTLKHAVKGLGGRVIDRRTTLGKALAKWRTDLIEDLGGTGAISTQQSALVDLAVKSKLLLDSIDAWLLTQPTLINARRRALLPVVLQRQTLADGLARYLNQLGLQRRHKVKSLQEILSAEHAEDNGNGKAD
jgi:hypothetical protein